jgi:hypothetical protein
MGLQRVARQVEVLGEGGSVVGIRLEVMPNDLVEGSLLRLNQTPAFEG